LIPDLRSSKEAKSTSKRPKRTALLAVVRSSKGHVPYLGEVYTRAPLKVTFE
jgi:hypothetical protein